MYHFSWKFLQLGCDMQWWWWLTWKFLYFQHMWQHWVRVSWWSTTPWTARIPRRRRPGRSLTKSLHMYHFSWNLFKLGCDMLWWWWLTSKFSFIFLTFVTTLRWCEFEVDDTVDGKENWEEKSMRVSLQEKYSSMRAGMWSAVLILGTFKCLPAPMCVTSDSTKVHDKEKEKDASKVES